MNNPLILAIDQGTSGTKSIVFNKKGEILSRGSVSLKSYYPKTGYVEQDPLEIYQNVLSSVRECLKEFNSNGGNQDDIQCCGISNQRETLVVWDKGGEPLHNAVVWQCKRSIDICNRLKEQGLEENIRQKTGLIIDPYFSGTKMIWLYENNIRIKEAVDSGKACFGNVDSWLLYKLTGGRVYLTDYTNASRTLFFNLESLEWDRDLLDDFGLKNLNLPGAVPSGYNFGVSDFDGLFKTPIPITGMIGDSHAAAFGEGCYQKGTAKATLGTGSSILWNAGSKPVFSGKGMVSTICWSTKDRVDYALEGVIVTCGATIEWLKNQLGLFAESTETESMATSVPDNNGVYLVPAFSGLGAPHWKMEAKAMITGLTFGADKNHLVRAALESIPFQIKDVISAMEEESGTPLIELKIDGGISANRFVVQMIADLLHTPVVSIGIADVSALGAALIAGLEDGIYSGIDELSAVHQKQLTVKPEASSEAASKAYMGWKEQIERYY